MEQCANPAFVIKCDIRDVTADVYAFPRQKTMYGGKQIAVGNIVFLFASETSGGIGLFARGIVCSVQPVARDIGLARQTPRVGIHVDRLTRARQTLGRKDLKMFSQWDDGRPQTELNFKLYRQATNKIVGVTPPTAVFLNGFF